MTSVLVNKRGEFGAWVTVVENGLELSVTTQAVSGRSFVLKRSFATKEETAREAQRQIAALKRRYRIVSSSELQSLREAAGVTDAVLSQRISEMAQQGGGEASQSRRRRLESL